MIHIENYKPGKKERFHTHFLYPCVVMNRNTIRFNRYSLQQLFPFGYISNKYVRILINPKEERLLVHATDSSSEGAVLCCHDDGSVRTIEAKGMCEKIYQLMGWNKDDRMIIAGSDVLDSSILIFDLKSAEFVKTE